MKHRYTRLGFKLEDRLYKQAELLRCAVKFRHANYWTALQQAASMKVARPVATVRVYECIYCDGLHLTSGKVYKRPDKLQKSLESLEAMMAQPGYAEKAPKEIQAQHTHLAKALRARLAELQPTEIEDDAPEPQEKS